MYTGHGFRVLGSTFLTEVQLDELPETRHKAGIEGPHKTL